jgi:hypothetical protein
VELSIRGAGGSRSQHSIVLEQARRIGSRLGSFMSGRRASVGVGNNASMYYAAAS